MIVLFIIWYIIGVVSFIYEVKRGVDKGIDVSYGDVFIIIVCSILGPAITVVLFYRYLSDKVLIKGRGR